MANEYMPISISLKERPCLVVGGGQVALRKVEALLNYDCRITVIAPTPEKKIEYYAEKGKLNLEKREYRSGEAKSYGIVISAGDSRDLNRAVRDDCTSAGIPVNVVDDPELCDFVFPAVVRRDLLTVAVSSDGKAPFLSGHLRLVLEEIFPDSWGRIARLAAGFRRKVRDRWRKEHAKRSGCYERFVSVDWKSELKDKTDDELEQMLQHLIEP
jgi:uroporphyrin-III C-methyltransferase/precorrin-2 dehydrogenase/sirohydrochlorin ferrochelatase